MEKIGGEECMNEVEVVVPIGYGDPTTGAPVPELLEAGLRSLKSQILHITLTCAVNDDFVNDDRMEIVRNYADKIEIFPSPSYFRRGGIWLKIWECWKKSNAEYVAWQGYDDISDIWRFKKQYKTIKATKANSCFCEAKLKSGKVIKAMHPDKNNIDFLSYLGRHIPFMGAFLLRRKAILSSGLGEYRDKWSYYFEGLLYAFILKTGKPAISDGVFFYVDHPATITHTVTEKEEWVKEQVRRAGYTFEQCKEDWKSIDFQGICNSVRRRYNMPDVQEEGVMRLGVSYNAFSGCELLELSIRQIRKLVDYIVIVYQEKSWFGNSIRKEDRNIIFDLKRRGVVDDVVEFIPPYYIREAVEINRVYKLECKKRNRGRRACEKAGCTHYLDLDVDEFFIPEEFERAKKYIFNNKIDFSVVQYYNYYKKPIYRDKENSNWSMFISRIIPNIPLGKPGGIIKVRGSEQYCVDGTRAYETNGYIVEYIPFVKMHHFKAVRKDIEWKLTEYSGRKPYLDQHIPKILSNLEEIQDDNLFLRRKVLFWNGENYPLVKVENIFGIPDFEEGEE